MGNENRIRVLAEALSIDAWHKPFRTDGGTSSAHVELSFHRGRLGGARRDWPFTFSISLKRALLTVQVEEPLQIDRSSINRPKILSAAERSHTVTVRENVKANLGAGISLGKGATFTAAAGAGAERSDAREEKVKQELPLIIANPRPRGPSAYSWELVPGQSAFLLGQPWDPENEPRFHVKSLTNLDSVEPAIKVTLSCSFEDLVIDDLKLKQDGIFERFKDAIQGRNNEAAAVQYLKIALANAELEIGEIDNRFSEILLADLISAVN